MSTLSSLFHFFFKYKWRFAGGVIFILLSNYFAVLAPQLTGLVIDMVQSQLPGYEAKAKTFNDPFLLAIINYLGSLDFSFNSMIALCCLTLLFLALLRGLFMFLMRQTLIVMSRLIEYDQKNQIYSHYQQLDAEFYKTHQTGDLMNRISEDVSRVRMFTGPAVMYLINLIVLISFTVYYMFRKNAELSFIVLAPLPVLAFAIYWVNSIIHRKSEQVQGLLSGLTVDAQQAYSGIRVIKSYVQEPFLLGLFGKRSEAYRKAATGLNKTEALYFPSMALIIGISTLLIIYAGGNAYMRGEILFGDMAAFVMYLTMLTFPVSAIGWVASTIQRAAASQKRINEFLKYKPAIEQAGGNKYLLKGDIEFRNVTLVYPHSGTTALKQVSFKINAGEKIAIVGRTGSGKSTLLQLLMRYYDPSSGQVLIDNKVITDWDIRHFRSQTGYVPQESFLFSDSILNNINFGKTNLGSDEASRAAEMASVLHDIKGFEKGFDTMVGERGITLSGGQKQRIAIARAFIMNPSLFILDDSLSAVDYQTEQKVLNALMNYTKDKTLVFVTNRIFSLAEFDRVLLLENGEIVESGTHQELLSLNGKYKNMYENRHFEPS
jgi:ATP-binding cassette subfamily B protein